MEMLRSASISRKTRETDIHVALVIDGTGKSAVSTGVPFLDHMLELWSRHGFFDLEIQAQGDLQVDGHHTFEDLGLVLGEAFLKALGDKTGIRRYGQCLSPMDETLVLIALDLSGRPGLYYDMCPPAELVAGFDARLFHEFFQAFCVKCGLNLHIRQIASGENHHLFEAVFKGLARALDMATQIDPRINGVLSTKGAL